MKRLSISFLLLATSVALVTSCTEDIESINSPTDEKMVFTAGTASVGKGTVTRGAQTTSATLTSFGVSATAYPASSTYEGKGLGNYFYNIECRPNVATSYPWPTDDYKIAFYAYAPFGCPNLTISAQGAAGLPSYTYTVPSAIATQADFMTAQVTDRACSDHSAVSLTFDHRCTDIRFSCENVGAESVTLKSVAINGVKYSGTLNGSTWSLSPSVNSSSSNPFVLTVDKAIAPEGTLDVTGTTNHFIMLPQTVASGTQVFDIYATVGGETGHFYYTLTSNLTLEAGKVYTFNLKLSDLLEVVTSIEDWNEETDRTGIPTYQNSITTSFGIGSWESE